MIEVWGAQKSFFLNELMMCYRSWENVRRGRAEICAPHILGCHTSKDSSLSLRMRSGKTAYQVGTRGAKISRPPLRAQCHILKDSSLTLRMTVYVDRICHLSIRNGNGYNFKVLLDFSSVEVYNRIIWNIK